ncbi:oxygen-dependent coproporphyrinogen oxidase [Orrella sp. 11846]|uniref:oxygen-dependent coproporphyrinogen oxidase n=1 Tax=Orrella sp. 11846 TaxID=3409913 RepID=UPI003B59E1A9
MNAPLKVDTARVKDYFLTLQQSIVSGLEALDGTPFQTDRWTREQGGGGVSRLLENGQVFERAGVLFSHVMGDTLPASATSHRPAVAGRRWEAMGVSLVLHPDNPFVPTTHMNVRMFVAYAQPGSEDHDIFWFGGGMDLTPYYVFEEDAKHFHQSCYDALNAHDPALYPAYKAWCDEYFYLKHRQETRGVGGVFFDDLNEPGFEESFSITRSVGDAFLGAYQPIVQKRQQLPFEPLHKDFQHYRRGRYVEFNLVFDRGTLFGLQSGGRTESILMSMPPVVNWRYDWHPAPGSEEAKLYEYLTPKDWLACE